jgi:Xaa-Pro aminopeptidase
MTYYSGVFFDDGLGLDAAKARYKARRDALLKKLDAPVVILGVQSPQTSPYTWLLTYHAVYQEPAMSYLTGINQAHTALYMDPKTGEEILFLPSKNPKHEFWEGYQLGVGTPEAEADVENVTGFSRCEDRGTLTDFILEKVTASSLKSLKLFWNEVKPKQKPIYDENAEFKHALVAVFKKKGLPVELTNVAGPLWQQRLCLDNTDVENMRQANILTTEALTTVMRQLPNLPSEREVSGTLLGELHKRTEKGISFPPIVAGGKNACVLHYNKNDEVLDKNSLILFDCGMRWHSMPSDISRTVPVSGTFNPLQKLVYNIVLDAHEKVETAAKAGITIKELNDMTWAYIEKELKTKILDQGGSIEKEYESAPHGVSHLIGIMVHDGDPYRNYKEEPLRPGMVISNEPGFYGKVTMEIDGKSYSEYMGIRIEDDLLITKDGCRNLSEGCPKTVDDIEALFKGLTLK